ncbi:hydrolase [Luteimicrobium sp. DT211]|uniref:hydrolase n=1 Tax=Luteimicrobium sp. DT211 TaxID=3393412 RepID=UPI003CEC6F0B
MTTDDFWICRTCGVERADRPELCPICADERQYVVESGQTWTTLAELAADGCRVRVDELEPGLHALRGDPGVGIEQESKVVVTPHGNLLWDPLGYLDDEAVAAVRGLGEVVAIASSHPHMFGVQVEWSRRLGGVPVLVAEADASWVGRPDDAIETWSGSREVVPGLTLHQVGGHFPGSGVVHWAGTADGKGALLSGDTVFVNADRKSVTFMRSYPNHLPLSAAVVERIASRLEPLGFDRIYHNFHGRIAADGHGVLRRSADRYAAWVRGDHDDLT